MNRFDEGGSPPVELFSDLESLSNQGRPHAAAIDVLIKELRLKVPVYFELRSPEPVSLDELQASVGVNSRMLNADEALVLWMVVPGERHGLVFAVGRTRAAWATIGLSGHAIDARVNRLRNQIDPCSYGVRAGDCNFGQQEFDLTASWELHQALLGDAAIQQVIGGAEIRTLLIVPSGSLTTLPPALLLTERPVDVSESAETWQNGTWLITKKAISVMPSVSALRTLRVPTVGAMPASTHSARKDRLFMIANPDFSGKGLRPVVCASGKRAVPLAPIPQSSTALEATAIRNALGLLQPLPCTEVEGVALLEALGGTLLKGRDARESQLRTPVNRDLLARAEVVAFATHGIVAGGLGQDEPALALGAPMAGEIDDTGLLTASKIAGMKLSADWVLLSACNTASPDSQGAPGLSGLSRAFLFAGAKSVLVSHWRVDDEATAALISRAVEVRKQGAGKALALQRASVDIMNRGGQTAHPRFWAAFTLMGDPD